MSNIRLHRSTNNQMIAGVCSGLAKQINMDPTIMRIIFIVATLAGFSGALAYFILWAVMPSDTDLDLR